MVHLWISRNSRQTPMPCPTRWSHLACSYVAVELIQVTKIFPSLVSHSYFHPSRHCSSPTLPKKLERYSIWSLFLGLGLVFQHWLHFRLYQILNVRKHNILVFNECFSLSINIYHLPFNMNGHLKSTLFMCVGERDQLTYLLKKTCEHVYGSKFSCKTIPIHE